MPESPYREGIAWYPRCTIEKYSAGQVAWARRRLPSVDGQSLRRMFPVPEGGIARDEGNGVAAAGLANLALVLTGSGGHPLAPGRVVFGVGTGPEEFSPDHGHLSPAEGEAPHRTYYRPMDQGYPQVPGLGLIEGQATFTEDEACFTWHEWCWAAGPPAPQPHHSLYLAYGSGTPVMVNRKASAIGYGTKEAGVAWVFRTQVTLR
jgi:hypothetical protein